MKLFAKYSRVNIVASVLALLIGSVVYYFSVRYVLVGELDDSLKVEEAEILDYVAVHDRLPQPANYKDQRIEFQPVTTGVARKFHHTVLSGGEPYRELLFSVRAGGQLYRVSVAKDEEETESLVELIMLITAGMIGVLLGILFLANRLLLRRLWRPFYETLDAIRRFNLSSRQPLADNHTNTDEFRHLNAAVQQMTGKILKDYEMLKNFTDNASHEMQTPLAIINSKLDLLIQDAAVGAAHHQSLQSMYDAIGRLRQLNQSLLLLMKIENNQFGYSEPVDMAALIREKLGQLDDQIKSRELELHAELGALQLPVNGYLADILLNNLFLNAIRHNREGGSITVHLSNVRLRISNTGSELGFDPGTIFNRFTKGAHSGGTGLGLAIVRQICDNYQYSLSYTYKDQRHVIEVQFIK
ncbi:MAG: HAMP domain-containing histidine kinase [Bacteroidetes bacterium]|nr:HAMP domain-containing histidine kinase [Bacteroidota bacterium]